MLKRIAFSFNAQLVEYIVIYAYILPLWTASNVVLFLSIAGAFGALGTQQTTGLGIGTLGRYKMLFFTK